MGPVPLEDVRMKEDALHYVMKLIRRMNLSKAISCYAKAVRECPSVIGKVINKANTLV